MRALTTIDELNIASKQKNFISTFIIKASQIENPDKIDRLILFVSCAREEATENSDVDIAAIGEKIMTILYLSYMIVL